MNMPLASPSRARHAPDRDNDPRSVVSAMRHLVVSAQPAVVFTSLAELCVPAFSDDCRIIIEEEGHVGYRIIRPVPDPGSQLAALSQEYVTRAGGSRQLVSEHTVRTPILAMQLSGERYRGVVVHHWRTGHHPTRTEVSRAQRILDRAVAAVHQERLTSRLGQQRCTTENLQQALGAGANPEIDAAIGILMTCHRVTYAQAFDLLRIASRQSHRKLRGLATNVVRTGVLAPVGRIRQIRAQSPALRVMPTGCDLEPRSTPSGRR